MKKFRKITAATLMAATAVTASAADAIGSFYDTELTLGSKHEDKIPYDKDDLSYGDFYYNDGKNYRDYTVTAPSEGTMIISYDAAISGSKIDVYNVEIYESVESECTAMTGSASASNVYPHYGNYIWDTNAGVFVGCVTFKTEANTSYILRVGRANDYLGRSGDGTIHITAQMKLAGDANNDGRVNAKDATLVLKKVARVEE